MPEDVKEHLRTIAGSKAAPTADLDGFIQLVDLAVKEYWPMKSIQDQALAKTVREELKMAHEASQRLIDRVNALGGTSRQLLYSEGGAGTFERFGEALMYIPGQLALARGRADELSKKGGAPRSFAKTSLAAVVAHAIRTHLKVKPTTTSGGVFEDVLKTVIEAVEKREDRHVRALMQAALKARVTGQVGSLIEIEPWVE